MPALLALVEAADWNQTEDDWRRIIHLAGPDALGIEIANRIAASATLLRYPTHLAWLGMVLTLPEYRGRGLASALLKALLDRTSSEQSIYLDATSQGQPIYERLGFRDVGVIRRWFGECPWQSEMLAPPVTPPAETFPAALDREAFGADRSALLQSMPDARTWQLPDGSFAMLRPGRQQLYWGPVIARNSSSAAELCRLALPGRGPVYWDILDGNRPAIELAGSLGLSPHRRLIRMVKGPARENNPALEFGIAGFEYG